MGGRSSISSIRKHLAFTKKEVEELLTISLIFAFILSFQDWGEVNFDYVVGASHLLQAFLAVLFSVFAALLVQKLYAIRHGLVAEHVVWSKGLIASLLIGLFTNGYALVTLCSSFKLKRVRKLGHGRGVGLNQLAKTAAAGLFTHAGIAALAKVIFDFAPIYIAEKAMLFNLVYIAWNMLPLPQLVGSIVFLYSRVWYVFGFFTAVAFTLLGFVGLPSFILAIAVGLCASFLFFEKYEKKWT